jgi:hypothetical protein
MAFCIDSALPCFAAFGEQTANLLRDRFQPALTHSLVGDYVNGLIDSSLGSSWTRLYDSVSFLPCQRLFCLIKAAFSINTTHSQSYDENRIRPWNSSHEARFYAEVESRLRTFSVLDSAFNSLPKSASLSSIEGYS